MESERDWAIRKTMAEHIHVQVGTNSSETESPRSYHIVRRISWMASILPSLLSSS